ncbi:MAG: 2-oxoacid:acceptor oxidoreductase family protein [Candidatus Heimdallarchaeota archaeon]
MFVEIRFLSRGGQGGVTGAKLLAYAGHLDGYYVQAIPKYGSERKGAPIATDVRLSSDPIRTHAPVAASDADYWVVFDPSVIEKHLPRDQLKDGAVLVLNSLTAPDFGPNTRVGTVDAVGIAKKTGLIKSGTVLVSTTMLGAWAKAAGMIKLESILKSVEKTFGSGDMAEQNKRSIQMAYDQFHWVE